jgi:hypothetical protein
MRDMICIFTLDRLGKDHGFCPDCRRLVSHSCIGGLELAAGAGTKQMRQVEVVRFRRRDLGHRRNADPRQEASVKAIELSSTAVAV